MNTRLLVFLNGTDISDCITTKNGKGNPFGWSQYELWHKDIKQIGWVESGSVAIYEKGYTFKEVELK